MEETGAKRRLGRRVAVLAASGIVAAGALWLWLMLRRQDLLPETILVQPQTAAFLAYTIQPDDAVLIDLLDGAPGARGSGARSARLRPAQVKALLPLRLIAVLGPAHGAERPLTVAVSLSRALPLALRTLAGPADQVETYRGQAIRAPIGGPGYVAQMANRLLWSSQREELRGAIDRLIEPPDDDLPQRFSDLSDDASAGTAGALYLFNDGQPFSIADGDRGGTRLRLPAGFIGLSFHFDLADSDTLIGWGRLRFRGRAAADAQAPALRALLDAAAPGPGKLHYRIEPAGATDLTLTLRSKGLRRLIERALDRAVRPLQRAAANAR